MLRNRLINFEIQKYYRNKLRFNPNRAGLFEGSSFLMRGGSQFDPPPPFIFQKDLI